MPILYMKKLETEEKYLTQSQINFDSRACTTMVLPLGPDYLLMPKKSLEQINVWECFGRLQSLKINLNGSAKEN